MSGAGVCTRRWCWCGGRRLRVMAMWMLTIVARARVAMKMRMEQSEDEIRFREKWYGVIVELGRRDARVLGFGVLRFGEGWI